MSVLTENIADVYGETYASAKAQMDLLQTAIKDRTGKGFDSPEACASWAKEHHLDMLVYSKAQKGFYNMSHHGELFTMTHWKRYYCDDVLFYWVQAKDGEQKRIPWLPLGNAYHECARIPGERTDGIRAPITHRDYVTPTGYYDPITSTFNLAKPFPVFAKATGADTSYIYELIKHVAMECNEWLLAWLRLKMLYPKRKTEIVPVISSRTQGNGKTSIAEAICKGLFGKENVIVTNQFDANSRFNADFADALVVCAEEKHEDDKRVDAASLKSLSTATTVRKEHKNIDPVYQDSYTEFMVTTNKDVPIKFDSTDDQRRFMVMGGDESFTRKGSKLADEVFTLLYGIDKDGKPVGTPFVDDVNVVAQFKHELFHNERLQKIDLRNWPKTEAHQRCFSLPRTTENTEIDAILRSLAPFIRQALFEKKVVTQVLAEDGKTMLSLSNFITAIQAVQYMGPYKDMPAYVALCRPLIFYDQNSGKPFAHASVERGIIDCTHWLAAEYGLKILPLQLPLPGGFMQVMTRYRNAPAARFALIEDAAVNQIDESIPVTVKDPEVMVVSEQRIGTRLRVNSQWKPDINGEYETVNEMKPGVTTLDKKNENVQYMDTFLFEADDVPKNVYALEQTRLNGTTSKQATIVFMERLRLQLYEANRLLDEGIAFRVVYSGGKSYHVLVRIKDAPVNLDEYKWLHAHLCDGVLSKKLDYDPSCCDPGRLTRAPITFERHFMYNGASLTGTQALHREKPGQVFDYCWRPLYEEWQNRPLAAWEVNGKRLRPCKQEYKEAMHALLSGTFWYDSAYNGRRQQCFFPAYRLCRLLGYSHEQLWSPEGVLDGLERYYRKREIDYWRSRENSEIIKEIDIDCDLMNEE